MGDVVFGRYTLLKRLAVGGMAEIWLAKQTGPGGFEKQLVVKRVLPNLTERPEFVKMFLDEARLVALLSHPHIVQIIEFGEEAGTYYLVMELVRGPNLRQLLRACAKANIEIPYNIAAHIMGRVCNALGYAHQAQDAAGQPLHLIHRDVSPQNVLLSFDGSIRIVDFGIAKSAAQTQFSDSGTVKGKFAYLAPEQVEGLPLDGRVDVYAAGLVLYELITGRQAMGGGQGSILKALQALITPAEQYRPDLPRHLQEILHKALAKDRSLRFGSAPEMEAALEHFLSGWGKPTTSYDLARFLERVQAEAGDPLTLAGMSPGDLLEKGTEVAEINDATVLEEPEWHDVSFTNVRIPTGGGAPGMGRPPLPPPDALPAVIYRGHSKPIAKGPLFQGLELANENRGRLRSTILASFAMVTIAAIAGSSVYALRVSRARKEAEALATPVVGVQPSPSPVAAPVDTSAVLPASATAAGPGVAIIPNAAVPPKPPEGQPRRAPRRPRSDP